MKNKSINKKLQAIINAAVVIILAPLFLALFVDSPYVFTLRQVFGYDYSYNNEDDCVTFLNVGQGDSVLIRSNGEAVLIDTGDGESTDIIRALKQNGINNLDILVLTHWHNDHIGGAQTVLKEFPVDNLVLPNMPDEKDEAYSYALKIKEAAESSDTRFTAAVQGMVVSVGDFELTVLYYPDSFSENNRSIVIMAECHGFKFLLMSDAEEYLEEQLLDCEIELDCDLLKVGHHGSETSTSVKFLDAASPDYAVISVGLKNEYGHPDSKVINRLSSANTEVYRTDICGEIDVFVLEDGLDIKEELID